MSERTAPVRVAEIEQQISAAADDINVLWLMHPEHEGCARLAWRHLSDARTALKAIASEFSAEPQKD